MLKPLLALPVVSSEPLIVSVNRGGARESEHAVDVALCDDQGRVIIGLGEVERVVFPRSAMKPLQALALVERLEDMPAAQQLGDAELALLCASHNGEPDHVATARDMLTRFALSAEGLACGPQWSSDQTTLIAQARSLEQTTRLHNNCSGKHAGMMILAHLLAVDIKGYERISHPVQQTILGAMEGLTGVDLMNHPHGIDGCSAPALSAPLGNWARAFALFAGAGELPEHRRAACVRLRHAIAAAPHMIAGQRRLCSELARTLSGRITAKVGAEGVYAAALHEPQLGLMLKARDGTTRAAEVALGAVLHALGYEPSPSLTPYFAPVLRNWAGLDVGDISVTGGALCGTMARSGL